MNRLSLLLFIVVLGLATGCRRVTPPGGASGSRAQAARKQAETLAVSAVNGAAEAEVRSNPSAGPRRRRARRSRGRDRVARGGISTDRETAWASRAESAHGAAAINRSIVIELQPKAPPRAGPTPIIHARVASLVPAVNEAEAEEEAINAARDLVEKKLAELDPPVKYRPSANEVKNEFLRRDSRAVTTLKEATGPRAEAMRKVLKEQLV